MENEIWKDIEGYEGYYQVSNLGNIKSLNYGNRGFAKNLTPKINNDGYKWVELFKDGSKKCFLVHRLVASAFLDNPNHYPIVNHKDEKPLNCNATNLEWCNNSYNVKYSLYKGRTSKYSTTQICQLTLNGELIKVWRNLRELKHKMNYHNTSIKECCEGKRKTAYGYKWEFADKNASSLFI